MHNMDTSEGNRPLWMADIEATDVPEGAGRDRALKNLDGPSEGAEACPRYQRILSEQPLSGRSALGGQKTPGTALRLLAAALLRVLSATSGHTIDQETAMPMTGFKVQPP